MIPAARTKMNPLAIAQAKKIHADGSPPTITFSKPKVSVINLKGRMWAWRQMRALKSQIRKAEKERQDLVNLGYSVIQSEVNPVSFDCRIGGKVIGMASGDENLGSTIEKAWGVNLKHAKQNNPGFGAGLALSLVLAVLTTTGKQWVIDKIQEEPAGATMPLMKWIGWGTGATAEAVGNTTLATEDTGGSPAYARVVGVLSQPAADTDRCVGTITSNGTKTITEAARFNQLASGGTMYVRALFTGIPMVLNDRIEFTIDNQQT